MVKKGLIGCGIAIVVCVLAVLIFARLTFDTECRIQIRRETPSPDGALRATFFATDCGDTLHIRHLSIFDKEEKITDASGNVLDTKYVTWDKSKPEPETVRVEWTGPRELTIHVSPRMLDSHETSGPHGVVLKYVDR